MIPHSEFHEVWWIYAPERHPWGGARIAHFRKTANGTTIVVITGETDARRVGVRVWDDISPREGWVKVKQSELPSRAEIDAAIDAAIREIVQNIKTEMFDQQIAKL